MTATWEHDGPVCRLVRTSSIDGSYGLPSVRIRSTVPRPPPESENPTQFAIQ